VTRLAKIALCLWLVTQPGCHWILGALGAKATEEDKAEDWHNCCSPPKCDLHRCWCKVCGRWC